MIWFHVSELALDQLLAGELHQADAAAIHDHAASCERCGALLADALAVQRSFAEARPLLRLPRRRSLVPAVAATLALAAGIALVISRPDAAVRTKGTPILGAFVRHGAQVRRAAAHEAVAVGDTVELATTTTEPMWFAALGADGTVYVAPTEVPAEPEHVVEVAIALDSSETITGIFCAHAFDPKAPPAGCTTDHLTLEAP